MTIFLTILILGGLYLMSEKLDAMKAELGAALDEIVKDIADLKDQVAKGIPESEVEAVFQPLIDKATALAEPFHTA